MTTTELAHQIEPVMKRLLHTICQYPSCVEVTAKSLLNKVVVVWRVHKSDMPRVIGHDGTNFDAIKTLVESGGVRNGIETEVSPLYEPTRTRAFQDNAIWLNRTAQLDALGDLLLHATGMRPEIHPFHQGGLSITLVMLDAHKTIRDAAQVVADSITRATSCERIVVEQAGEVAP